MPGMLRCRARDRCRLALTGAALRADTADGEEFGELSRRPPPATVDAERVADDDRLRSNYVRKLLWEAPHGIPSPPANEIPTTIMHFWDNASAIPADLSEYL